MDGERIPTVDGKEVKDPAQDIAVCVFETFQVYDYHFVSCIVRTPLFNVPSPTVF